MYTFKNMTLPENHGFDDNHVKFLQTIDEALEKAKEGISKKEDFETLKAAMQTKFDDLKGTLDFEKMQKQINDVYVEIAKAGLKPSTLTDEQRKAEERKLNSQWVRALVKKDKPAMKELETKLSEYYIHPVMNTGGGTTEIEADMTQGGYLIPELLLAEVNRFIEEGGIARREFRYLPFDGAGNSRYIPTLLTNVVVDWIDEGETKPKTKPYIGRVEQTLKKIAAMVIMTEEIVEDTVIDLVGFCGQLIGEAIAAEEDNQFFAGNGAPWVGIINNGGVVSLPMAVGDTIGDLTPEHLVAMTVAIPTGAVPGAKFYMHRTIWAYLRAYRSDAVVANDRRGDYLMQDPTGSSPGTAWGFPVVLVEAMPSFTEVAANPDTPFMIFGNLGKCVAYGDKKGIRVKLLDQASVYDENNNLVNLAERDMIALRVHKRVGYVCILPEGIAVLQTGPVS